MEQKSGSILQYKSADSTYRQQGHGANQLFDTAQHCTALHARQGAVCYNKTTH